MAGCTPNELAPVFLCVADVGPLLLAKLRLIVTSSYEEMAESAKLA